MKNVNSKQAKSNSGQSLANSVMHSLLKDKDDLTQMQQLLQDERRSLEQREHQHFETLVQQKIALTKQIETRSKQREQLLASAHRKVMPESWRPIVEQLGNASKLPLIELWNEVEVSLNNCSEQLKINEKIVRHMKVSVDQFLTTLRGKTNTGQTYEASGKISGHSENQSITNA